MDVSVIIVNYNTTELVTACIQSVYQYTRKNSFEIIVVDNASPDRSIENLRVIFPEITLIKNDANIGFGSANNVGIELAKGKYVFLLNSDTLLLSDAVAIFLDYMEVHLHVACCGGELVGPAGDKKVSYGNFPSLLAACSSLGLGLFYKKYYDRRLSSGVKVYKDKIHEVDYVSGADLFIRKSILDKTGSFDEDFFLYFEETELAFRMKKQGYSSVIIPEVKIVHFEGGSTGDRNSGVIKKHFEKSRMIFFDKCYGSYTAFIANCIFTIKDHINRIVPVNKIG